MAFSSLTLAAFIAVTAMPQEAVVSGRVLDASSGKPVAGAQVASRSARSGALTEEDGRFSLAVADEDTLVVTHGDYVQGQVVLGRVPAGMPPLDIVLTARLLGAAQTAARRALTAAEEMAARSGGSVWTREEFGPYLGRVTYPLGLLGYSGYATSAPSGRSGCVRLRGALGCASVWKNGEKTGSGALLDSSPSDVEAFVIVPPGEASVALDEVQANGIIVVYLREAP